MRDRAQRRRRRRRAARARAGAVSRRCRLASGRTLGSPRQEHGRVDERLLRSIPGRPQPRYLSERRHAGGPQALSPPPPLGPFLPLRQDPIQLILKDFYFLLAILYCRPLFLLFLSASLSSSLTAEAGEIGWPRPGSGDRRKGTSPKRTGRTSPASRASRSRGLACSGTCRAANGALRRWMSGRPWLAWRVRKPLTSLPTPSWPGRRRISPFTGRRVCSSGRAAPFRWFSTASGSRCWPACARREAPHASCSTRPAVT